MRRVGFALAAMFVTLPALAQSNPDAGIHTSVIETIEVLYHRLLIGNGLDLDQVPAGVVALSGAEMARTGTRTATDALAAVAPGVVLDDAQGNMVAPNLLYHGFEASPLLGNGQGLAVYVDGVRFNEPFGDTVNWGLFPDNAIKSINLEGANPIFGLNALGGGLSVELKNGFNSPGGELSLEGGTTGYGNPEMEYGAARGNNAIYVAASGTYDHGWRDHSVSQVGQFYGRFDHVGSGGSYSLGVTSAEDRLNGPGTTPVQLIDADPRAAFTSPNLTIDKVLQINQHVTYDIATGKSLQATFYVENYRQKIVNGNTANVNVCAAPGYLCDGATPLVTVSGAPITDFRNGGPYTQLNVQTVNTNRLGSTVQFSDDQDVLARSNKFLAGVAGDVAFSTFSASAALGGMTIGRAFVGPGIVFVDPAAAIAPVHVGITSVSTGIYLSDVFAITPNLALTLGARENIANLDLHDFNGGAISGANNYDHLNPSAGLSWHANKVWTFYAGVSEANRTPNPAELSCAGPSSPCTLANFFVGDPPLKQVIARGYEIGWRGHDHAWSWALGLYRTDSRDDIIFESSATPGLAYFQNVPSTRRQGVDASAAYLQGPLDFWVSYSLTDASFQTPLTLSSPLNPYADANGNIFVRPGDHLPGVPEHVLKFGISDDVTDDLTLGSTAKLQSGAYLFGDESNQNKTTGTFFVVNLNASYRLTSKISVFAAVDNLLGARYYTFGTFSDVGAIPIAQVPNASNTRSLSLAAPVEASVGVKYKF